jgi:hypothetical protein
MPATKYSYNKAVFVPQLDDEIRSSGIVTDIGWIEALGEPTNTVDVWMSDALSAGDVAVLDGLITAHTPPATLSALDEAKKIAKQEIDDAAGMARRRYITVAPGQDAVYVEKGKDAQAYKDAGYPVDETGYEFVTAEKNATGKTATQATDDMLALGASWKVVAANIEEIRIGKKQEIDNAVDVATVNSLRYNGRVLLDNV